MKTHWMGLMGCLVLSQVQAEGFSEEQAFRYELEMSKDDTVCGHMQQVYNENFRQPWKTEPMDLAGQTYSEYSKYARIVGIYRQPRIIFLSLIYTPSISQKPSRQR
jgi:hypothetical protein